MDKPEWSEEQLRGYHTLRWSRYVMVASAVILFWDHCLTFSQEVRLIWPSRAKFVKRAFLANRYIVPLVFIINLHTQSGISDFGLSDNVCRGWIMTVFSIAGLSLSVSQWLVLLKLWKLWGAQSKVIYTTLAGYFILQAGSITWIILNAREALPLIHFFHTTRMCGLTDRPQLLRGLYAWLLFFEIVAYVMVCYNALSRPRGFDDQLLRILIRDGILFFMATVTMRVLNLIMAVIDLPTQIFLGIYGIWGILLTIVSRMILDTRQAEYDRDSTEDWHDSLAEMENQLQTYGETKVMVISRQNMGNPRTSFNAGNNGEMHESLAPSSKRLSGFSEASLEISETLRSETLVGSPHSKKWIKTINDA
ncbi:hypothetical protein M422DRAFT_69494 [Sphaerobolus stellatus SS14]|uniref:DUF6533 domain-containing protein n=1 Tax=Sphaerobolus stellatus (strain SS14) TaxID=990650 RepID=A0A0C9U2M4_SPHS4|nr:hypothetical protein M422DRAFT_69494 [Sphaerobolus stellatus SS14]